LKNWLCCPSQTAAVSRWARLQQPKNPLFAFAAGYVISGRG
jgi:hypothetical protein